MQTFLSGIYGNIDILNSWFICNQMMAVCYLLGMGFGDSMRTFVGIKIGKKEYKLAKKFSQWGII